MHGLCVTVNQMNRRQLFLTTGLLATTGALAATRRQSLSRPPRLITTKDGGAYLLGAIEPVLGGKITSLAVAPKGRFTLVIQSLRPEPTDDDKLPFGEEKLWLYDAKRRTTKLLHRTQDDLTTGVRQSLGQPIWFPDSKKAVIALISRKHDEDKETKISYALVDIERGSLRGLSLPADLLWNANPVPGTSLLLFQGYALKTMEYGQVCFLSSEGRFTPLAKFTTLIPNLMGLSADGKSAIFLEPTFTGEGEQPVRKDLWKAVRLQDAQLTPLADKPADMQTSKLLLAPVKRALMLHKTKATLTSTSGRTEQTQALWLDATEPSQEKQKKYERAFITAEGSFPELLADLSAVLFSRDGALYAMPIASLDRLALEKFLSELAKKKARQVGLGLIMYCQDHDENFPHDPASVKEAISPYIKNNDVFADFVYTYSGPLNSSKLAKPAETVLGYIPSPGGRAVVYGDGHVKWEPSAQN